MTATATNTEPDRARVAAVLCDEPDLHRTLAQLAQATGLSQRAVRAALTALGDDVESVVVTSNDKRRRAWCLTSEAQVRWCVRGVAELQQRAQTLSEAELQQLTRAQLRELVLALDELATVPVKAPKARLLAILLALREDALSASCACGEPVDKAGDVCTICQEAQAPKRTPRKKRTARRKGRTVRLRRLRRKDVSLDHLSAETLDEIAQAVSGETSARGGQRAIAEVLGRDGALIEIEVLRTLCRKHDVLNKPNFALYPTKNGWTRVVEDGVLKGWTL